MRRDLDDRVVGSAIVGFGVWTLLCHAVVFAGGSLRSLLAVAGFVALGGGIATVVVWMRHRGQKTTGPSDETSEPPPSPATPSRLPAAPSAWAPPIKARIGVAAIAAAAVAIHVGWPASDGLWIVAVPLLAGLALFEWWPATSQDFGGPSPPVKPARPAALWGLALACGVLAVTLHRPDADDALYLNLAVAAVDAPGEALIARDTLHGFPDIPLSLPVYKVHSFELLSGALAALTPMRVLDAAHVVVPFLAGLLLPLAWGRLFKSLVPSRWLLTTAILAVTLFTLGDPQRGYGNFGFVRLQQGKAVLLSVMLPLVMATALEYARSPSRSRWALLALAQIGAVGTSASGLWLAPLVAGVSLLSATAINASGIAVALRGVAASAYPLAVGLWLASETAERFAASATDWASHGEVEFALDAVLGHGPLMVVSLFVLAGWWALAATAPLRRFGLAFGLVFFAFFWNPLTNSLVAHTITSEPTYWRVFWIVPIPALLALAVASPLDGARNPRLAAACVAAACAVLWLVVPARWVNAPETGVFIAAPGWKIPPNVAEAAQALAQSAPAGEAVLAPTLVSRWLPVLHDHPNPLVVRELYLGSLRGRIPDDEIRRRELLARFVGGIQRPKLGAAWLAEAIDDIPLAAVCVSAQSTQWPELTRTLENSPLERVWSNASFEVWARP